MSIGSAATAAEPLEPRLAVDVTPGPSGSYPYGFTELNGRLFGKVHRLNQIEG